ncbi:MAG: tripartite tricarboxylate transporter TctB family protein [Chloroflexota bacterium]
MRLLYQAASLSFFAAGAFLVWQALRLQFYTPLGPGPGFFPLWLGLILTVISVLWFGQVSLRPVAPMEKNFIPDRSGTFRILAILGALVAYTALLDLFGYRLTTLAFLLFLLAALGRQHPLITGAVALAGSFGVYHVFLYWLSVPLPTASIWFLKDLGL